MSVYYQDDLVTLYHGDCLSAHLEWLAAEVLVTDPPYGVKWRPRLGGYKDKEHLNQVNSGGVKNDGDTAARDEALLMWGSKPAVVFGSWKAPRPPKVKGRLIWDKAGAKPGPLNAAFYTADEEIYIIGAGFRASSPPQRSVITTTELRSQEVRTVGHPTPKPVGLMELLIDRCPPGVVADPFAGSGATLIAARNQGRKVIGVELEEKYCEIIAKRCAQDVLDIFGGAA